MSKVATEGELSTYACVCGKTVIRSSISPKKTTRHEQMKDLGIEKYRDIQGGEIEFDDDDF